MCRQDCADSVNGPGTQAGLLSTQEPKWKEHGPHLSWGAGAEVMGRDTLTAQPCEHDASALP